MIGRDKTKLALFGLLGFIILIVVVVFVFNNDDNKSDSSKKDSHKNSTTTTTTKSQASTTPVSVPESTRTTLALDNVTISLSTPIENQKFENETVSVRAIIEGATSGTCNLKFSKNGSADINLSAPIVQGPTYFSCQGFDVEPSEFKEKGEWNLELSVVTKNGKSGSERRKISIS